MINTFDEGIQYLEFESLFVMLKYVWTWGQQQGLKRNPQSTMTRSNHRSSNTTTTMATSSRTMGMARTTYRPVLIGTLVMDLVFVGRAKSSKKWPLLEDKNIVKYLLQAKIYQA